jgi:hypothetical protein
VTADVGDGIRAGSPARSPEEDAVLEEVGEPRGGVRLVLGADVESGDDVDQRQVAFLVKKNAEPVVEDERPFPLVRANEAGERQHVVNQRIGTRGTFSVEVSRIGVSISPSSFTWVEPVSLPNPLPT